MKNRILIGTYHREEVKVSLSFSSCQCILGWTKRYPEWKPFHNSLFPIGAQFEKFLCEHWQGSYNNGVIYPEINFDCWEFSGTRDWLALQMIYTGKMNIYEAQKFGNWMRKVEHRILRTWNTNNWKKIKGLKKEEE